MQETDATVQPAPDATDWHGPARIQQNKTVTNYTASSDGASMHDELSMFKP